jgi:16S rRNA (cytidine1402-2'-O)-methyltransferase
MAATAIPLKDHIDSLIAEGMSKKDAIRQAAEERGIPKREAYNEYERCGDK